MTGVSPFVLGLRETLRARGILTVARFTVGDLLVRVCKSADSLWVVIRREGCGGLALRSAYLPTKFDCRLVHSASRPVPGLRVDSVLGRHVVEFEIGNGGLEQLRMIVRFTPAAPMLMPFMPRDLYPLDSHDDPLGAEGNVEAAQRGLNGGALYFRIDEPAFGNVLYFQNLTALNPYCRATKTKPDGVVGGEWPELGFLLPTPARSGTPPADPLPAGVEVTLSDVILVVRHGAPSDERDSARQFLEMLATAYALLDLPSTEYRDWVGRAEKTLRDLAEAPEATIRHYGHRYVHPYTAAEYPDAMVQASLVRSIHEWGKWRGSPPQLEKDFEAGFAKFYDSKLKSLRRYLPNVGDDKDKDAVDSWYLYHPLLNLAALALDGDETARALFLKSVDYGIKAAHHFNYRWPIQYKITDFTVIKQAATDGRGQTDVGGIYAWVMLQAFELTDDKRFLDEARAAIDAAIGLKFNLNYQANLTAWGAAACMRLWRITDRAVYLEQSYVYLASFFHNCQLWESEIELAVHYRNFLGATCLQDAPYMAMYECFESFAAFQRYLDDSGPELDPAAKMLVAEYCRFALDRAWFYYPDALPPEAISEKQREHNGHINRKLSFPLEDLYADGQKAGQVGQEIYGAGAAFVFAVRAFHNIEGASFRLYCDHFVSTMERVNDRCVAVALHGGERSTASLSLVRLPRQRPHGTTVMTSDGTPVKPQRRAPDRVDYRVPANGRILVSWA
ncbi:MAG: hypothetical protein J0H14_26625 [Alphaproteobacteria bacterium]|nr:hypothetical protein [Alphaproteobacteria bacterium]